MTTEFLTGLTLFRLCCMVAYSDTHTIMLTISQQVLESIKGASRILVVFRADGDSDAVGSALALAHLLEKMGKHQVTIASDGFKPNHQLAFLPKIKTVCDSISGICTYAIELDMKDVQLKNFQYDVKDEKLRIFLTPETGMFRQENVRHATSPFTFDLIMAVSTPDLESLGEVYSQNSKFFFATPIINIDHNPANEQYGHINCVDVTATSTGEVLFSLIEQLGRHYMDAELATNLLTSIIAKTRSFRVPRVTPRTLQITSQLVTHGADRETIVHHLYRTRSLSTLKLWGRVLSRLEHDVPSKLAWSTISAQDFDRTGSTHDHLPDIVEELIAHAPNVNATVIFYEDHVHQSPALSQSTGNGPVCVLVCANAPHSALDLAHSFHPKGSREKVHFDLPSHTMEEAKHDVLTAIRSRMATAVAT